jgi:predicted nucleic acid-binding protein
MKEYIGRTHAPDLLILQAFIQDLRNNGKWRSFDTSSINSNFRRRERVRIIHYPSHSKDKKWIRVAVAIQASCIISTNGHLLEVPPNRTNGDTIEIVDPDR